MLANRLAVYKKRYKKKEKGFPRILRGFIYVSSNLGKRWVERKKNR
jgi:hypothetical protein